MKVGGWKRRRIGCERWCVAVFRSTKLFRECVESAWCSCVLRRMSVAETYTSERSPLVRSRNDQLHYARVTEDDTGHRNAGTGASSSGTFESELHLVLSASHPHRPSVSASFTHVHLPRPVILSFARRQRGINGFTPMP